VVFLKILWIVPLLILLSGCAPKSYEQKYSSHITIRSDGLRYSDMGFMYENANEVKVEIYSFATPIFTLTMHSNICIDRACYHYEVFNKRYLHASYPDRLIRDVFQAKPIFGAKNIKRSEDGFEQFIQTREYDIIYSVSKELIRFQDKKNNILLQIRKI